jgi:iron(III) transport system permease protein
LLLVIGWPLAMPLLDLAARPEGWQAWMEPRRLLVLAANTAALVGGTLLVAVPAGVGAAIALYRTDLPLRKLFRLLVLLLMFVPLPLAASAWQAALGAGGWLPVGLWNRAGSDDPDASPAGIVWKPWAHGLGAAIWVHAVTGFPWVVWITGRGLCWVERPLEEDGLTSANVGAVVWHITLARSRGTLVAASLWLAMQTATEITVTDVMQVNTFAEEVYTQMNTGGPAAIVRSVAAAAPAVVLTGLLLWWVIRRLERNLPSLETLTTAPLQFRLRWFSPVLSCILLVFFGALAGVPLASLVWKCGAHGYPARWSGLVMMSLVKAVLSIHWKLIALNLLSSLAAGLVTAGLCLVACWVSVGSWRLLLLLLGLGAAAWAMPAPVVGFGLKQVIGHLMDASSSETLATALYRGPSPLPVLWVEVVRFFPVGIAMLWPVVRLIPTELRDGTRLDGARPGQELRYVVWPLTNAVVVQTAVVVAVLSLGEIGAGKVVETPGSTTLAHEIFNQMHYGVGNDLAALSLVLLGVVVLGSLGLEALSRLLPSTRELPRL